MKNILLFSFFVCAFFARSSSETPNVVSNPIDGIAISHQWTEYKTVDGVKIEYKMTKCDDGKMRAQNILLFRFTNTTSQELTVSWIAKEFRNEECWNCTRLDDPEYAHELKLAPLEVIEGKGGSNYQKSFYIFGNFIKLVPGMTEQTLTNFELVDLSVD
ncbi:MAG: hypothetical protein HRT58_15550 [Crocinitomicaceae bacterium]|nr:hypothetical protein [Flavobacteriales bacterium]NQZ37084.1 hypothetical protein [Crocinitomicaceae bacterium]